MKLEARGSVFVLTLDDGENRLNPRSVAAWSDALNQIENTPGPRALVTVGVGKIWSNGIDLDSVGPSSPGWAGFLAQLHGLYAQVLSASFPTIAAVQGHAFAGGLMLALCHDVRIMRADRGWLCLPEIDLSMAFTPGMTELLVAKLGAPLAGQAMTTARRYTGPEAHAAGMVDETVPEGVVLERAVNIAAELATKDSATLQAIKQGLYARALATLAS